MQILRETEYLITNECPDEGSIATYVLVAWRLREKYSLRKDI